jgi:hypothetical protein
MRERGEVDVIFVRSEENSSDILTKNVPEKLMSTHGTRIRDGTLRCRKDWHEIVGAIELTDESINHVQWEDVELWIRNQTDEDRRSEITMNCRDEFVTYRDSFDVKGNRMETYYS